MTTTATTDRTTCPDWCQTDHVKDPALSHSHSGPSWPSIPDMRGIAYHAVQISAGDWHGDGVTVYLDAGHLALTPEQARAAGLALLSAASWAKDHQVSA